MCRTGQNMHHLAAASSENFCEGDDLEVNDFVMDEITTEKSRKEWNIHLNISRRRVGFKVDTGAQCNILSEEMFNVLKTEGNLGNKTTIKPSKVTLTSFSGHKMKPIGQCSILCEFRNKYYLEISILCIL